MNIPETMKAAVMRGVKQFEIERVPVPEIGPDDILIKVMACGICGSDLLAYYGQHPRIKYPRIPGHEFSGIVVKVGENADNVKIGDRVTSEMQVRCGKCWACRHGYLNHCVTKASIGLSEDGAMAQYVKVPAINAIKLPENVDFEIGAVAETLAVGYNAVRLKAKVGAGDIVVIIGAGSVGMDVLLAAKASGAYIIISDIIKERLCIAQKAGASRVVQTGVEDLKSVVMEVSQGRGADKVFETVGGNSTGTVRLAVEIVRPLGTVMVLGTNSNNSSEFPVTTFKENEIVMMGSRGIPYDCLERALLILEQEQVDLQLVISHRLDLDDVKNAFEMFENQKDKTLKMVINKFD